LVCFQILVQTPKSVCRSLFRLRVHSCSH